MSLRQIAEETNLGLNTVRTIIAQAKRTDPPLSGARRAGSDRPATAGALETAEAIQ